MMSAVWRSVFLRALISMNVKDRPINHILNGPIGANAQNEGHGHVVELNLAFNQPKDHGSTITSRSISR